ncbi:MAG: terminase [Robiginitomaculum sp.]|nr:MAG: terminase [Robiginitomaculum sp.]
MNELVGYMGNPNLKKAGQEAGIPQEHLEEYIKCMLDPIYFTETYIKIVHPDDGLVPMKMYDYQKEIVDKVSNSRRVTVVTSRQAGKTSTAVAIILHYSIFNNHKTVALLANKGDAAREILDRIKIGYESLPSWLQRGVVYWNKGSVELENGCKIIAAATSSSAIRGKSVQFLYIDEAAFVEGWDEFFASVFPTISAGKQTKILFTSTPNGMNHFHKTCVSAQKKHTDTESWNGYEYVEVPWQRVPGRDEEWRLETLQALDFDLEKFGQEFECEFMGSSGTLISGNKLKELVHQIPLETADGLSMYTAPVKEHNYVSIVDVSRGKGLDYSAFQVIDVTKMPYEIVATYRDNLVTPIEYVEVIFRVCKLFNMAVALIEINDIGGQVSDLLYHEYEYENVLHTESAGSRGKRISMGYGKSVDRGIRTTKSVKSVGCSILKLLVEQNQLLIPDFETIKELSTFSRRGTSYQAESGRHDDLVMCLVLFAWLSDQQYFQDFTDINTLTQLRERTQEEITSSLTPFGFIEDGQGEEELYDFEQTAYVDPDYWLRM